MRVYQFQIFILSIFQCYGFRQVSGPFYNPDCPREINCSTFQAPNNSVNNLLYFNAAGLNDKVHFLISTINGLSILLIRADLGSELKLNWSQFLSKSDEISIFIKNGRVRSSLAISFTKLYRYDDSRDTAKIETADIVESMNFSELLWSNVSIIQNKLRANLKTSNNESLNRNFLGDDGEIEILLQAFDSQAHYQKMPKLLHDDQSVQLEIGLKNLSPFNFTQIRYAVELAVVSDNPSELFSVSTKRTIDDEYTPGIFDTNYVKVGNDKGYLMWKPVCYYDEARSLKSLSRVTHSSEGFKKEKVSVGGLVAPYFGFNLDIYAVQSINISFGLTKDDFYPGYMLWTFVIGAGQPPSETFSALVITLLAVCLGTPFGALVLGGGYGMYVKFGRKNRIDEDIVGPEIANDEITTTTTDSGVVSF